jgi:hypothetical protein
MNCQICSADIKEDQSWITYKEGQVHLKRAQIDSLIGMACLADMAAFLGEDYLKDCIWGVVLSNDPDVEIRRLREVVSPEGSVTFHLISAVHSLKRGDYKKAEHCILKVAEHTGAIEYMKGEFV